MDCDLFGSKIVIRVKQWERRLVLVLVLVEEQRRQIQGEGGSYIEEQHDRTHRGFILSPGSDVRGHESRR